VFFPALGGLNVKGAARWVRLGINFQPSELAKLSIIIFLAWYGANTLRSFDISGKVLFCQW
jgi:cell division protein FtsW (lipid II flippase)